MPGWKREVGRRLDAAIARAVRRAAALGVGAAGGRPAGVGPV